MAGTMQEEAIKLRQNIDKVYNAGYDAGKQAEYDSFWDNAQDYGNRTDYTYAFGKSFNNNNFKPKYSLEKITNAAYMFRYLEYKGDLAQLFEDLGIMFSFVQNNPNAPFRDMPYVTRLFSVDCTLAYTVSSINYFFYNFFINFTFG